MLFHPDLDLSPFPRLLNMTKCPFELSSTNFAKRNVLVSFPAQGFTSPSRFQILLFLFTNIFLFLYYGVM